MAAMPSRWWKEQCFVSRFLVRSSEREALRLRRRSSSSILQTLEPAQAFYWKAYEADSGMYSVCIDCGDDEDGAAGIVNRNPTAWNADSVSFINSKILRTNLRTSHWRFL